MSTHTMTGTTLEVDSAWLNVEHELDYFVQRLEDFHPVKVAVAEREAESAKLILLGTQAALEELFRDELALDADMIAYHLHAHRVIVGHGPATTYVPRHGA